MNTTKKSAFKSFFQTASPVKKQGYLQEVPVIQKAEIPPSGLSTAPLVPTSTSSSSMFPNDTVLYQDEFRDMILSTNYDETLIRPLPIFHIAIKMQKGDDGETSVIPLTLRHGDKDGSIYGYVEAIETHAKGTIFNHAYNPDALFRTTVLDIGAHITKQHCDFKFSVPSADKTASEIQAFRWKQCKGDAEVMSLAKERTVEAHDWSKVGWGEKRGMKLFQENTGEVFAVYVGGKSHSKMNPLKIMAKVKWLESPTWTDELKLAAFLALMTYLEKTRRVGTGGGGGGGG